MRLEWVRSAGVGANGGDRVSIGAGVTVMMGPNGAGKTRFARIVRGLLTGTAPDGLAAAELAFTDGRNHFVLRRDFAAGDAAFLETGPDGRELAAINTVGAANGDIAAALAQALGPGVLEAWLRAGLDPLSADAAAGWYRGGDVRSAAAGDDPACVLEDELRELRGAPGEDGGEPGSGGAIAMLGAERAEREAALVAWEERADEMGRLLEKRDTLAPTLDEARRSAAAREETHATLGRFSELVRERNRVDAHLRELNTRRDEVRRAVETVEQAERALEERYSDFLNAGVDLEEQLQAWTEASSRLHDIQRRLHLARQAVAGAPVTHTRRNGAVAGMILGVLGFLACLGAGATQVGFVVGPLLAVLGFGAVWAKDRSVESMKRIRREEIHALEAETGDAEAAIHATREALGPLGRLGHPMAIRRSTVHYWKAKEEVEDLRKRRDALPRLTEVLDACEEDLQHRRVLDAECRDLVARAPYLAALESMPDSLAGEADMARAQFEASQARFRRMEEEYREADRRIEELASTAMPPGRLEAETLELRERLADLERRARVLDIAVAVLREAREEYRSNRAGRLADRAGALLGRVTGGTLVALRLAGAERVEALGADGSSIDEAALSDGTRDQLRFALRMAVLAEDGAGHPLPLLLDEPFLAWDEDRRAVAREVLREHAAAGGQVVVLSHRREFAEWGDVVVELDGPPDHARRAA